MINLTITKEASEQIKNKMTDQDLVLKLKYETEGCGCVLSGVPTLQLLRQQDLDVDDMIIETNDIDVYIEKSKTIFFDEEMKIDFSQQSQIFRLTSPREILNGRMSCKRLTN